MLQELIISFLSIESLYCRRLLRKSVCDSNAQRASRRIRNQSVLPRRPSVRVEHSHAPLSIDSNFCYSAKAAADGAILYYLDQYVHSRIARMTYGVPVWWNRNDPQLLFLEPSRKAVSLPSGAQVIYGGFFPILVEGTAVSKETEFRYTLCEEGGERGEASKVKMDVYAYKGPGHPPMWRDEPETSRETLMLRAILIKPQKRTRYVL